MSRMADFITTVVEQYADNKSIDEIVDYIWTAYGTRVSRKYIENVVLEYKDILEG